MSSLVSKFHVRSGSNAIRFRVPEKLDPTDSVLLLHPHTLPVSSYRLTGSVCGIFLVTARTSLARSWHPALSTIHSYLLFYCGPPRLRWDCWAWSTYDDRRFACNFYKLLAIVFSPFRITTNVTLLMSFNHIVMGLSVESPTKHTGYYFLFAFAFSAVIVFFCHNPIICLQMALAFTFRQTWFEKTSKILCFPHVSLNFINGLLP